MLYKRKLIITKYKIIRERHKNKPLDCYNCSFFDGWCGGECTMVVIFDYSGKLILATKKNLCTLFKRSLFYIEI